jgi:hypothetical protein
MSQKVTRKAIRCPVFGMPQDLSSVVLPTQYDIMKYFAYVKLQQKCTSEAKELPVSAVSEAVALKVEEVWKKASIPIVSHTRILKIIRTYHDEYRKLMKPYKGRKDDDNYKLKLKCFHDKSKTHLLDIAACKCDFSFCKCSKSCKVPVQEQEFLHDQRTFRLMFIGDIDKKSSEKNAKRLMRKAKEKARLQKCSDDYNELPTSSSTADEEQNTDGEYTEETNNEQSTDDEHTTILSGQPSTSKTETTTQQMRQKLSTLAQSCDRYGVSDRAGAAIATSVLQDFGIVTPEDNVSVIDRNKLRRERKRKRTEINKIPNKLQMQGLYFDGRKDKTIYTEEIGQKYHRRTIVQEHISLVQEPESTYIGHITPTSGSAKGIEKGIYEFLTQNNLDTNHILAVGCDGTVTNTGSKGGVICLLEKRLKKPLQWLVCQLHGNELPLRHLMEHLDGPTSGPRGFSGPIGGALLGCQHMPVVDFNRIETDFPINTVTDLSTDQQYLFDICHAVVSGQCSDDLARREPGKIAHSRWLTTANRILRLYVSTSRPTLQLQTLSTYIIKVYATVWFSIKMSPSCKDGASHLWKTVYLSRYLTAELKEIIDPVIQRNGYFGHPENLLLALVTDDRRHIRELGLRRILKARQQQSRAIRQFQIPKLNFEATSYIDLIDWQDASITEPPLLSKFSEDEIMTLIRDKDYSVIQFPRLPCHTQAVERCVKLVTEASVAVCGEEARDGYIRVRLESRRIMPVFDTKKHYKLKQETL